MAEKENKDIEQTKDNRVKDDKKEDGFLNKHLGIKNKKLFYGTLIAIPVVAVPLFIGGLYLRKRLKK